MKQAQAPLDTVVLATEVQACLPDRLHPVSRQFLDAWLLGDLPTHEFLRWFHMPNSDYLPVAECLLKAVFGV
ncbi:hypothetical protein [Algihabitans albus]|uniref:hypothetical protein n=1 Tax=Algihabitans albus TaxID=2164067 RepID=UPI000E5C8A19|nr:hypothetical protein [Algihabitans albus]